MNEEAFERLLGEIRRIADKVESLDGRLRGLEESEQRTEPEPAAETAGAPTERDGTFGPAIKRSDPTKHRKAVSTALAMLGVIPEAQPEPQPAAPASRNRQKHLAALQRIKQMQGAEAATSEPAPEPAAVAVAVEEPQPEPELERQPDPEPAPDPAPVELKVDGVRWEVAQAGEAATVDLSAAVAVDLTRPVISDRSHGLLLLVVECSVAGLILGFTPPWVGVPAMLLFLGVLVAPIWGRSTRTVRAHARLFTLVLLARTLFPDFLVAQPDQAWANPRFVAMVLATLPAWVLVATGRMGWSLAALLMSVVSGIAVGLESGSLPAALLVMVATAPAAVLLHVATGKSV